MTQLTRLFVPALTASLLAGGCATPATAEVHVTPPPAVPTVTEAPAAPAPAPVAAPAPAPEPEPPAHAPVPFSADAIRAATKPGRTYVFLVEEGDGPQKREKLEFVKVDEESTTMRLSEQDLFGRPRGEPKERVVSWDELVGHATYPADATTITEEKVTVRAGTYDAKLYTVDKTRDGERQVHRVWFAKQLPGPPIKQVVTVGGEPFRSLELFEHRPGG